MTDRPVDQPERDRALDPAGAFHLEAPAGSGKTTVLLDRFLTLLGLVESPDEILALTFTRKAAGELRARVMQLFETRADPGPEAPEHERRCLELVRRAFRRHIDQTGTVGLLERLRIMTFHSFCSLLLRLAPQEAGVPLEFKLLEEAEAEWFKLEAVEELRRRLAAQPPHDPVRQALVRRLARLNNNWSRLARELRELLGRRDSLGEFLQLVRASRSPEAYGQLLAKRLQLLISQDLQRLQADFAATPLGAAWPFFWQELDGKSAPLAGQLASRLPGGAPKELPAWQAIAQALLTKAGELRKSFAVGAGYPQDFKKTPWPELIRSLPGEVARQLHQCRELSLVAVSEGEAAAVQDLVILLAQALAVYQELCAKNRALDFIALEEAALRLLRLEHPQDLLLSLDCRLQHILVDEFQDTSLNQMTLLCRLLEGWEAGRGRSLVVVGDPKQSIYGWRQARLRLFLESRRGLPCGPGVAFPLEPLVLSTNFRATRQLITWVNQVFGETVMASGSASAEVEFHQAAPKPGAQDGEPPRLGLFTEAGSLDARTAEARWLAGQVAGTMENLREKESIGVLLFARTHLVTYLEAFKAAGVPVRLKEGLKLAESSVVQHLHNLARALVRPQDELAWAAVLRGPWGRGSLQLLTRVAGLEEDLWAEKLRRLADAPDCPADWREPLAALLSARDQVGRRPLEEILRRWLDAAEAWPGIAAWEGPAGVANARTYLDLLAMAESGLPEATFFKADFHLEETFQPADPQAQDSPVEMLTVHGAKGLEFDTLFLPGLDWQPLQKEGRTPPPFVMEEIPGTRLHGLALARPYAHARHSSLYQALRHVKNRRILAEARRVFYVAVTRARQRLVLSGVIKQNGRGDWQVPAASPLGWLWDHYTPEDLAPGVPLTWLQPEMRVKLLAEVPPPAAKGPPAVTLPEPWEFHPEPAPYGLQYPSQLAEWSAAEAGGGSGDDAGVALLRGELVHRLLEGLAQGQGLPPLAGVAASIRAAGLSPEAAQSLAGEVLAEAAACLADPFLARLLAPDLPEAASEWLLEDQPAPGLIRRGQIDRLVYDGRDWWILDYKTSRPAREADWDEFMQKEAEKYRPQLLAYRAMAARARGLADPRAIRLALYFTAKRKRVEL
jgi:ATP-dependent exoDNAse (exonuclease V) beta subunit